jgi:molybdopterin converting factor small subunit
MRIRVEFQSYLDQYSPTGEHEFVYDAPEGWTIGDLLRRFEVPEDMSAVIAVGDSAADTAHVLSEGEKVTVIPPVAGG